MYLHILTGRSRNIFLTFIDFLHLVLTDTRGECSPFGTRYRYSRKSADAYILFFRVIHSSVDVFIRPISNHARDRSKSTCRDLMKSRLRISRNYRDSRSSPEFKCCRIWRRSSSYITAWMDPDFESIDHGKDNHILCGRRWNFDVVSRSRRIHFIKYVNIYCYIFYSLIISCYFGDIPVISHKSSFPPPPLSLSHFMFYILVDTYLIHASCVKYSCVKYFDTKLTF